MAQSAAAIHAGLLAAGAVPRYVGVRLGQVQSAERRAARSRSHAWRRCPPCCSTRWSCPAATRRPKTLGNVGHALEFIKDQYRHCKPILALGAGTDLVENAGVPATLAVRRAGPGFAVASPKTSAEEALPQFIKAIAKHRHHEREMDPPAV